MDVKLVAILLAAAVLIMLFIGGIYYAYRRKVRKIFELPVLPPGSTILVEGPIDSKKTTLCHSFLQTLAEHGATATILASNVGDHLPWFKGALKPDALNRVVVKEAQLSLTELGMMISEAANSGSKAIFIPVLPVLLVNEKIENVANFIRFNSEKTRAKGVYLLFTLDPSATMKGNVPLLELLMDCIVELKTDDGEFVRIKRIVGREPEMEWRPL